MKKECIIIDIDGTLANIEHRRKDIPVEKNWKKFNSKMYLDKINPWCRELINSFKERYEVLIVTGRSKDFHEVTVKWLKDNDVFYTEIFFREKNDYRDDTIIKKEIYNKYIAPGYSTLIVVDDRNKVVKMWRDIGLTCLQCNYGDF